METALLFGSVLGVFFLVAGVLARRDRERFNERFPPISDEEFVARCASGTDPATALKVRDIIADCLGVDASQVYPEARLIGDLGAE